MHLEKKRGGQGAVADTKRLFRQTPDLSFLLHCKEQKVKKLFHQALHCTLSCRLGKVV